MQDSISCPTKAAAALEVDVMLLASGTRWMLLAAALLVLGAGSDLLLFPDRTETMFAWTVKPPWTAAFLGANYLAAGVIEFGAARQRTWARARAAVPAVMLFTVLTAAITLLNISYFNVANPMAWVWFIVYFGVPPILGWVWRRQLRLPGHDEPRTSSLPASLRATLMALGGLLAIFGLALLFLPVWASPAWPWSLESVYGSDTSAMETYVGVWLIAWGTVMLHASFENDPERTGYVFMALLVLGVLQGVAAFYLDRGGIWHTSSGKVYWLVLALVCALGLWGLALMARTRVHQAAMDRKPGDTERTL